ncbi:MAG: type IV pili methyl-accepting chemotaxis transducer N-terminal domain-containing protein [Bacteroidota bacterium]
MAKSLQTRLGLLFVAFALLVLVSVGVMYWQLETQNQDAVLINVAGRQRMLVQRMNLLVVQVVEGDHPTAGAELQNTDSLFEESLSALKDGGAAPGLPGDPVQLAAPQDSRVLAATAQISRAWTAYREAQGELLSLPAGSSLAGTIRAQLQERSDTLLRESDSLVLLFQDLSIEKMRSLRSTQIAFLICAVLLLGAGAWMFEASILKPLRALEDAAKRIGENDLDTPVHLGGPRELGLLAQSLDDMRMHLKSSRAELVALAETLEQRVAQRTRELEALNDVGREISSQLNLQQVLDSVTQKARSLLHAEVASLCLLDEEGQRLHLRALSGPHAAIVNDCIPAKEEFANSVLTAEQALNCGQCEGGCQMLRSTYRVSHLAAPLSVGRQVIGALCVGASEQDHFPEESSESLSKLANTAAIALENARLYSQAERIAALEERNRIAAEMHDGLGQTLSYLGLMTDEMAALLAEEQYDAVGENLHRTREAIDQAVRETREAISSLLNLPRPGADLYVRLRQITEEFIRETKLPVSWQQDPGSAPECTPEAAEQVLNIAREALNNVAHHAHAKHVAVQMARDGGSYCIVIQDDGNGFDTAQPSPSGHFGLQIMQARAAHIGGRVEIQSSPGEGTRLRLTWPSGDGA